MDRPKKLLRVYAWNPKGIKSLLDQSEWLTRFLIQEQPDIIFFPECKPGANVAEVEARLRTVFSGALPDVEWVWHWSCYNSKPYLHGNAVAIRKNVAIDAISYELQPGSGESEAEGRVITVHVAGGPILVGLYVPNASTGLVRLAYKCEWLQKLRVLLDTLQIQNPARSVIVLGDMNVAPDERDICNPSSNTKTPGYTPEERTAYADHVLSGYVDVWRALHPIPKKPLQKHKGQYTFWTMRNGDAARNTNAGWRLDAVLVDNVTWNNKRNTIQESIICSTIRGSDHCPVGIHVLM